MQAYYDADVNYNESFNGFHVHLEKIMSSITKIKFTMKEIECVDIPTMSGMSDDNYLEFLRHGELGGLMYVDHHDVLRSYVADYPLATSREQFDILIEFANIAQQNGSPITKMN